MLNISNFPWAECSITDNRVMYQSDSLSLRRTKRDTGILRYEFELVTTQMDMTEGRGVKAKLSAAASDTMLFIHPRLSYTQGTEPASGVATIGTSAAGSKTVDVAGFGEAWQLMAGDYIQFLNDTKVYEVAEDTLLAVGTQTVHLTSPIRKQTNNGDSLTVNGVTWYLQSNGQIEVGMEASQNQDMEITLIAVEKL